MKSFLFYLNLVVEEENDNPNDIRYGFLACDAMYRSLIGTIAS